ncbi:MAG: hypothetical protein IJB63_00245 [Alistipes sp.]|nr:hypothetical protein [Alistipes sp.]
MEIEKYNIAKKIDKEIAELQDCKLLLMKGCNIELLKDGKNSTILTFENDLREQMVKYIEQRVDNLWEKFKKL